MVHVGRIGAEKKMALTAGLALLVGVGGLAWGGEGGKRGTAVFVGSRAGDAYVLARGGHGTSASVSVDEVVELQKKFSGKFLWVRRGGKKFLIRDQAVLDQAQSFFEPLRALEPERKALHIKQREFEREEAALDRDLEEIYRRAEDLEDDHGERAAAVCRDLKRQEEVLRPRMRRLEARQRELDGVERSLDEREEVLEKRAEERLWQLIDATLSRGLAERADSR